jgi:actin-related protein
MPSIVGRPKPWGPKMDQTHYLNNEIASNWEDLIFSYPKINCQRLNQEEVEIIWERAFLEGIGEFPNKRDLILTEDFLTPLSSSAFYAELAFESFNFSRFMTTAVAPLSLYAAGKVTGVSGRNKECVQIKIISVHGGDLTTTICSVFDGIMLPLQTKRFEVSGRQLTDYLTRLMTERGYNFMSSSRDFEFAKRIKEALCYVSPYIQNARFIKYHF